LAKHETDYLALTAMLAARSANMVTDDRMERMLTAPSFDEAAKIPEECGYGDLSGKNAEEVNAALGTLDDETAVNVTALFEPWESGESYAVGDRRRYNG
jgi:hypothetical protein